MVRSVARRLAADEDEGENWELPELAELVALRNEAEAALAAGVHTLRRHGMSWADIGRELGCTRQAAHERFGKSAPVE